MILVSVTQSPAHPWMHKHVAMAVNRLLMQKGVRVIYPSWNPFEHGLHRIVVDFLKVHTDCTHWLHIDADNPPINNPLELLEYDRDIIGLPTPIIHINDKKPGEFPVCINAWDYVPEEDAYREHRPKEGLQRVDAIGTGCFLISKRVFLHPEMQKGAFQRTYYENGIVNKGNDIAFSERARMCGFEIFCHYGYICHHFKEVEILELMNAFLRWKEVQDGD